MKPTTTLACAIALLLIFNACKKEKDETPAPATPATITYDNYSNLTIGNYWIYQNYYLDTVGNVSSVGDIDSCYVEKDSVLNGHTYKKMLDFTFSSPSFPSVSFYLLRDSLSYTVDMWGKVLFSSTDFSSTFNFHYWIDIPLDTFAVVHSHMLPVMESKVVPAGFFNTLDYRTTYDLYPHYAIVNQSLYAYSWYAKNIGLVAKRDPLSYWGRTSEERRLIRSYLN